MYKKFISLWKKLYGKYFSKQPFARVLEHKKMLIKLWISVIFKNIARHQHFLFVEFDVMRLNSDYEKCDNF